MPTPSSMSSRGLPPRGSASLRLLALAGLLLAGCTPHLYSAPTRVAPLESSRPLDVGQTSLQVGGGYHSETWGIDASTVSLRASRGVAEHLDVSANAGLAHIVGQGAADVHPNIYTGRLGLRWAPPRLGNYLALTAGVGGGASQAGGLVSGDIGYIAAYENDVLVPFTATSVWLSQPVGAREVDLSLEGEPLGTDVQVAETTWGTSTALGLYVPLRFGAGNGPRGGVYLALTLTSLRDSEDASLLVGVSPGIEVAF